MTRVDSCICEIYNTWNVHNVYIIMSTVHNVELYIFIIMLHRWLLFVSADCNPSGDSCLTPSLPQPVKIPGWEVLTYAWKWRKKSVLHQTSFQYCAFWWKSLYRLMQNRKEESSRGILNLALLLLGFKRHRGTERVKRLRQSYQDPQCSRPWARPLHHKAVPFMDTDSLSHWAKTGSRVAALSEWQHTFHTGRKCVAGFYDEDLRRSQLAHCLYTAVL